MMTAQIKLASLSRTSIFVYSSFGNAGLEVSPEEVKRLRAEPMDKVTGPAPPKNPFDNRSDARL